MKTTVVSIVTPETKVTTDYGVFWQDNIILTADSSCGDSFETVDSVANNLVSMHPGSKMNMEEVSVDELPEDWNWDDVKSLLKLKLKLPSRIKDVHPSFSLSEYGTKLEVYKAKASYYESVVQRLESLIGNMEEDIYIVCSERDHYDPLKSTGAIAFETMTGQANLSNALNFAHRLNNKYGQLIISRLTPVGPPDFCETLLESRYNHQVTS